MRDERDEVRAQSGQAPELLDGSVLRVVGADVLHGGAREPPDERHELDLFGVERVGVASREGDEPDRGRADEQGRHEARMQAEREQLVLLGMLHLVEVAPVHRPPARHDFEDRPRAGSRGTGGKHVVDARARGREHLEAVALDEHDGDAVERHERTHLADERLERVLEHERGAERTRATVRGLEHVDAPAERVSQLLRLGRAFVRELGLTCEAEDEPADDEADDDLAAGLEGDVVGVKALPRVVRPQPLELDQHRQRQSRQHERAEDREPDCGLDDREVHHLPHGRAALVVVDEQVRGDDRGVEADSCDGEQHLPVARQVSPTEPEEDRGADRRTPPSSPTP